MADNENTITVVGRIGQEPELRATSKGDVLSFNIATNERKRGPGDSWSDGATSWFHVSAWDDLARNGHASFHRGQLVIVRGVLTIREFQLESGGKSRQAELRATALGHDLRWGTSSYAAGARPTAQQTAPPESPTVVPPETAPRLETVAAAAANWGTTFADETPF